MTNYFCKRCGTLMNHVGDAFSGQNFIRLDIIDDFNLRETRLRPTVEHSTKDRVSWVVGPQGEDVVHLKGFGTEDVLELVREAIV